MLLRWQMETTEYDNMVKSVCALTRKNIFYEVVCYIRTHMQHLQERKPFI